MGKTIQQIRDSIKEQVSAFYINDDNRIDNGWLEDEIVAINESLLREEIKANKTLPDRYFNFIEDIDVAREEVSSTTIAGITLTSGDYIYKSVLPSLLDGVGWTNIKYLGITSLDADSSFTRKTMNGYMSSEGNKWTKDNTIYTVLGDMIFYKNLPTEGTRTVSGIFILSDQRDGDGWSDSTSEFITPSVYKLELLTIKQIFASYQVPADMINDANSFIQQKQNDGKE